MTDCVYAYHFEDQYGEVVEFVPGARFVDDVPSEVGLNLGTGTTGKPPCGEALRYGLTLSEAGELHCNALESLKVNWGTREHTGKETGYVVGIKDVPPPSNPQLTFDQAVFLVVSHWKGLPIVKIPIVGCTVADMEAWTTYEQPKLIASIQKPSGGGFVVFVNTEANWLHYPMGDVGVGVVPGRCLPAELLEQSNLIGRAFFCTLKKIKGLPMPFCRPAALQFYESPQLAARTAGAAAGTKTNGCR